MKLGLWLLASALVTAGCAGGGDDILDETDSLIAPPDEPAGDKFALGEPCQASGDCRSGLCSAPWNGTPMPLVCVDTCVAKNDPTLWCADDSACCDPAAVCGSRGLCQIVVAADETSGDADTSATGTAGSTTGMDTGTAGGSSTDGETETATSSGSGSTGTGSTGTGSTGPG